LRGDDEIVFGGDDGVVVAGDDEVAVAGDDEVVVAGDDEVVVAGDDEVVVAGDDDVGSAGTSGRFILGVDSLSMPGGCAAIPSPALFPFDSTTLETGGISSLAPPASSSSLVQIASIFPSLVKDA
jgi:hypothetical protein